MSVAVRLPALVGWCSSLAAVSMLPWLNAQLSAVVFQCIAVTGLYRSRKKLKISVFATWESL